MLTCLEPACATCTRGPTTHPPLGPARLERRQPKIVSPSLYLRRAHASDTAGLSTGWVGTVFALHRRVSLLRVRVRGAHHPRAC